MNLFRWLFPRRFAPVLPPDHSRPSRRRKLAAFRKEQAASYLRGRLKPLRAKRRLVAWAVGLGEWRRGRWA